MGRRFDKGKGLKGFVTNNMLNKRPRFETKDVHSSSSRTNLDGYEKRPKKGASLVEDEVELSEEEVDSEESEGEDDQMEEEQEKDKELEVQREPSVYDTLLQKLETSSKSQSNGLKKRKRKDKSVSDTEEEGDTGSGSDEEDDKKGTDIDTGKYSRTDDPSKLSEEEASDIATDDDDVSDVEDDGNGHTSSCASKSKFVTHTTHELSKQDTETLLKRKWEYKWDMPAFDSTTVKWMGTGENFLKEDDVGAVAPYGLKLKLYNHWLDMYKASGNSNFESSKQLSFFNLCTSYRDILHHQKKGFYQKGSNEDSCIMDSYVMHSLNHAFKTRDLVTKNTAKLAKNEEKSNEDRFLDQGFTRPKVLILLPLASIALRLVRRLVHLTPSANKVSVEYMDRFKKEFGVDTEEDNDEPEVKDLKAQKPSKPSDFEALFGGNNNDHFMIGVKFTRKSIRLYSDFYSSDIIIASPLGLITKIGEVEAKKGKDVDYLSSIEILIVDHADIIAMQNWSHVQTVVEHLNRLPVETRADIMRLRSWYVDGYAQFYRQTIILSSYLNPDINALFNQHCLNFEGKLRLSCEYKGMLQKVVVPVRQVYERFDAKSIVEDDDARLDYFVKKVFPKIKDAIQGGVMLFISSYFEFVRIRNFLKSQNASFCLLSEYTKQSDISRARNWFIKGDRKIMLYTERAHFYHRYKIRGVQNLIIYSLPERKEFYPEVLNMLEESQNMSSTVLFSRFDQLRLERIVGSTAAKRMTRSEKSLFIFT